MDKISLAKREIDDGERLLEICREYGVCVVDSYLGEEEVREVRSEFRRWFEDPDAYAGVKNHTELSHTHALNIDYAALDKSLFPSITNLVSRPLFEQVTRAYHEEDDVVYPSNLWAARSRGTVDSPEGDPADGPPYAYHIDRKNKFKFFFYLTDVGLGDGPTHFIPEYHREYKQHRLDWLKRHGNPNDLDNLIWHYHVAGTAAEKEVPVVGSAGTLIVFDTDVPHRAGPLEQGHEREILRIDTLSPTHSGTGTPDRSSSRPHPILRGLRNPGKAARSLLHRLGG